MFKKLLGLNWVGTIYLVACSGKRIISDVYDVNGNYEINYLGDTVIIMPNGEVKGDKYYVHSWEPRTWDYPKP